MAKSSELSSLNMNANAMNKRFWERIMSEYVMTICLHKLSTCLSPKMFAMMN